MGDLCFFSVHKKIQERLLKHAFGSFHFSKHQDGTYMARNSSFALGKYQDMFALLFSIFSLTSTTKLGWDSGMELELLVF
jgi:hypothetical protein